MSFSLVKSKFLKKALFWNWCLGGSHVGRKSLIKMDRSAQAKGYAANARDYGLENHIKGFEKGGKLRQKSNEIVHAGIGEAHTRVKEAKALHKLAKSKPRKK